MYLFFLYMMAAFYIFAGVMHFIKPRMYIKIIPPYLPYPALLNAIAGLIEIIFGLGLLFESTRSLAAYGIIILLLAVFPANIYMYQKGSKGIPKWILLVRLPLQFALMAWAFVYT
ncbi:DoxX family protein [Mongoliibacter ruber]|uniref:Putative membrane protein n=1 Tax=Mongoliibacter ruber TaxID=1750599 RepID=A0A2T0WUY7_9BACT|nr:DoxX family protein [Mongoliibacter ruber]PRY90511.1 putative membrane protein [Mongoliibacter ruber]